MYKWTAKKNQYYVSNATFVKITKDDEDTHKITDITTSKEYNPPSSKTTAIRSNPTFADVLKKGTRAYTKGCNLNNINRQNYLLQRFGKRIGNISKLHSKIQVLDKPTNISTVPSKSQNVTKPSDINCTKLSAGKCMLTFENLRKLYGHELNSVCSNDMLQKEKNEMINISNSENVMNGNINISNVADISSEMEKKEEFHISDERIHLLTRENKKDSSLIEQDLKVNCSSIISLEPICKHKAGCERIIKNGKSNESLNKTVDNLDTIINYDTVHTKHLNKLNTSSCSPKIALGEVHVERFVKIISLSGLSVFFSHNESSFTLETDSDPVDPDSQSFIDNSVSAAGASFEKMQVYENKNDTCSVEEIVSCQSKSAVSNSSSEKQQSTDNAIELPELKHAMYSKSNDSEEKSIHSIYIETMLKIPEVTCNEKGNLCKVSRLFEGRNENWNEYYTGKEIEVKQVKQIYGNSRNEGISINHTKHSIPTIDDICPLLALSFLSRDKAQNISFSPREDMCSTRLPNRYNRLQVCGNNVRNRNLRSSIKRDYFHDFYWHEFKTILSKSINISLIYIGNIAYYEIRDQRNIIRYFEVNELRRNVMINFAIEKDHFYGSTGYKLNPHAEEFHPRL